jgi:hypothetical protein
MSDEEMIWDYCILSFVKFDDQRRLIGSNNVTKTTRCTSNFVEKEKPNSVEQMKKKTKVVVTLECLIFFLGRKQNKKRRNRKIDCEIVDQWSLCVKKYKQKIQIE